MTEGFASPSVVKAVGRKMGVDGSEDDHQEATTKPANGQEEGEVRYMILES